MSTTDQTAFNAPVLIEHLRASGLDFTNITVETYGFMREDTAILTDSRTGKKLWIYANSGNGNYSAYRGQAAESIYSSGVTLATLKSAIEHYFQHTTP